MLMVGLVLGDGSMALRCLMAMCKLSLSGSGNAVSAFGAALCLAYSLTKTVTKLFRIWQRKPPTVKGMLEETKTMRKLFRMFQRQAPQLEEMLEEGESNLQTVGSQLGHAARNLVERATSTAESLAGSSADKRLEEETPLMHENEIQKDGFALEAVQAESAVWGALQKLLETKASNLGKGKDVKDTRPYDRLSLARAWRVHHPSNMQKYQGGHQSIRTDMERIREQSLVKPQKESSDSAVNNIKDAFSKVLPLDETINEALLLHGTSPDNLLSMLSNGLNARLSGINAGTAFGDGVYLAEDIAKTDQYSTPDVSYSSHKLLHRRLYGLGCWHPNDVCYVLVCRVALGASVRTRHFKKNCPCRQVFGMPLAPCFKAGKSMDTGKDVFFVGPRELAQVPGVKPPVHYHSLVAELGRAIKRFREFIIFHDDNIQPEFVLAYQRYNGTKLLRNAKAKDQCICM